MKTLSHSLAFFLMTFNNNIHFYKSIKTKQIKTKHRAFKAKDCAIVGKIVFIFLKSGLRKKIVQLTIKQ